MGGKNTNLINSAGKEGDNLDARDGDGMTILKWISRKIFFKCRLERTDLGLYHMTGSLAEFNIRVLKEDNYLFIR